MKIAGPSAVACATMFTGKIASRHRSWFDIHSDDMHDAQAAPLSLLSDRLVELQCLHHGMSGSAKKGPHAAPGCGLLHDGVGLAFAFTA